MSGQYPVARLRLRVAGPLDDGVYLSAADVAGWLRSVGEDDLAELLEDAAQWPETETRTPFGVGA